MSKHDEILEEITRQGVTMNTTFIPYSKVSDEDRTSWGSSKFMSWNVELCGNGQKLKTPYRQGCGHCPGYKQCDRTISQDELIKFEIETGYAGKVLVSGQIMKSKKIELDIVDVVWSVCTDVQTVADCTFGDWSNEFGYSDDSIRARKIYDDLIQQRIMFLRVVKDFNKLVEVCQDY